MSQGTKGIQYRTIFSSWAADCCTSDCNLEGLTLKVDLREKCSPTKPAALHLSLFYLFHSNFYLMEIATKLCKPDSRNCSLVSSWYTKCSQNQWCAPVHFKCWQSQRAPGFKSHPTSGKALRTFLPHIRLPVLLVGETQHMTELSEHTLQASAVQTPCSTTHRVIKTVSLRPAFIHVKKVKSSYSTYFLNIEPLSLRQITQKTAW